MYAIVFSPACRVCVGAYREHRCGEQTPREKLQEDDDHSMVDTGLADSLRLRGCSDTDRHAQADT